MKLKKPTILTRNEANPNTMSTSYFQTPLSKNMKGFRDNCMMQEWIESKEDNSQATNNDLQTSMCSRMKYDRKQYQVQSNPSVIEKIENEDERLHEPSKANAEYYAGNNKPSLTYKKKIIEKPKYCLTEENELTNMFYTDNPSQSSCYIESHSKRVANLNDYFQTPEILKDEENSILFNTSSNTNNIQNLSVIAKTGNDKSFKYLTECELLGEDNPEDSIYNLKSSKRLAHKASESKSSQKTLSTQVQDHHRIFSDTSLDTIYLRAKEKATKQNKIKNQVIDEADELKFNYQSSYNSQNNRDSITAKNTKVPPIDANSEVMNNWSKPNERKNRIDFGKLNNLLSKNSQNSQNKDLNKSIAPISQPPNLYSLDFKFKENVTNNAISKGASQRTIKRVEVPQDDLDTDLFINNRLFNEPQDKGQSLRPKIVSNIPTFKLNIPLEQGFGPTQSISNDYAKLNTTRNTTIKSNPFNDCSEQYMQTTSYANRREIQSNADPYCLDDLGVNINNIDNPCHRRDESLLIISNKQASEIEDFTIKVAKKRSVQTTAKIPLTEHTVQVSQAKPALGKANIYGTEATLSRLNQFTSKSPAPDSTTYKFTETTSKVTTLPLKSESNNNKMRIFDSKSNLTSYSEYPKSQTSARAPNTLGTLLTKSSRKEDTTKKSKPTEKLTKTYNILHPKQQFNLNKP